MRWFELKAFVEEHAPNDAPDSIHPEWLKERLPIIDKELIEAAEVHPEALEFQNSYIDSLLRSLNSLKDDDHIETLSIACMEYCEEIRNMMILLENYWGKTEEEKEELAEQERGTWGLNI